MNDHLANTLIVFGVVLIALGAGVLHVAAGLIVLGAFCVYGGYRLAVSNVRG